MQTITLNVEDDFYNHFMELLKNISKDKVEVVETDFPQELVVSSSDEVRRRAYEAEERIENGEYLTQDKYRKEMDAFLKIL